MAKSAYQLFREGMDPSQIGNPRLRQQVRRLQQQNYQQQLQQVQANFQAGLAQGLTPGEAATTWVSGGQGGQYTIKDGDTLDKIAEATGSSPDTILQANPDMRAPETGMVINTPAFQPPVATGGGGIGLPSNAALGATTTNPQGSNYFQSEKFGAPIQKPRTSNFAASPLMKGLNWLRDVTTPNWNPNAFATPAELKFGEAAQNPQAFGAPPQGTPTQGVPTRKTAYAPRGNVVTLLDNITAQVGPAGRLPTDFELKQLLTHGRIKPVQARTAVGGGRYSSYASGRRGLGGGGGGGGGLARTARYDTGDNLPAFSNGGGFRGLVNWRI